MPVLTVNLFHHVIIASLVLILIGNKDATSVSAFVKVLKKDPIRVQIALIEAMKSKLCHPRPLSEIEKITNQDMASEAMELNELNEENVTKPS